MIYILKAKEVFKIGVTQNLEKRLKTLQTGCPFKIEVFFICETQNDYFIEQLLHKQYNEFNSYGEWFELSIIQANKIKNEILNFKNDSLLFKNKKSYNTYLFEIDKIIKNYSNNTDESIKIINKKERICLASLINVEYKNKFLSTSHIKKIFEENLKEKVSNHFVYKIIDLAYTFQNIKG